MRSVRAWSSFSKCRFAQPADFALGRGGEPPVNNSNQIVAFTLDEQSYALHLSAVEKIVLMVETTPLPKAPEIVLGVVNIQGRVIPVVNVRKRFRLPERELNLRDQLIIAHTSRRTVALIVDSVSSVVECSEQEVVAAKGG